MTNHKLIRELINQLHNANSTMKILAFDCKNATNNVTHNEKYAIELHGRVKYNEWLISQVEKEL